MFAPSIRSSTSVRRDKPYTRKPKTITRSDSILGTIKNIVAAPLSWFASSQEDFEELGKRRRKPGRDVSDSEEEQTQHKGKRMRVDGPELSLQRVRPSTGGYLDPPPFTDQSAQQPAARAAEDKNTYPRRSSVYDGQSLTNMRTMSVDPPSRFSILSRDPVMVPLPPGSPVRMTPPRSIGPDDGLRQPRTPFRLRTSLTPQPSPAKPIRRESSAPPPLSNLQSRPMFVRPPVEENQHARNRPQKTLSLGTLADFNRASRTPSRDRTLSGLGQSSSFPSQIASSVSSDAVLQPTKNRSHRAFHELEMYKTPILPSRYKDVDAIPSFLKPKRAHVPVPMMKKGRQSKPSLGMSSKAPREKSRHGTRDDGKPYARSGGIGKLLARRKAEQEADQGRNNVKSDLASVEEEDEMDTDIEPSNVKRDVGVSARMTSGSEDGRSRSRKAAVVAIVDIASTNVRDDPFSRQPTNAPGGRHQPYGRVGRTRTREPGQRSVPLSRSSNRFSAAFDDSETMEDVDQGSRAEESVSSESTKPDGFVAPKGFTFASVTSIIDQDHAKAKEPPIPSLPFALGAKCTPSIEPMASSQQTTSVKTPSSASTTNQPLVQQGEDKKDEHAPTAPKLSLVPPTPEQSISEVKAPLAPPSFFAAPSKTGTTPSPSGTPKPAGVPNFFANSPLLANTPTTTPTPKAQTQSAFPSVSTTSPAAPVKDPENPLWNGNNAKPSAPPKLFAAASMSSGLRGSSVGAASSSTPGVVGVSLFGDSFKQKSPGPEAGRQASISLFTPSAPSSTAPSAFGGAPQVSASSAKPAEPEKKPAPSQFNFDTASSSNAPKALFGTGSAAASNSPFSLPTGQAPQATSSGMEQKPTFSFTASQPSAPAKESTVSVQPSQATSTGSEQKSPFTLGASNSVGPGGDGTGVTVAAPKPLFGGTTGASTFTFGPSTAQTAPTTDAAKITSPFTFGAPPTTPPAGAERANSPFTFGAPAPPTPASTGFTFDTPTKTNGTAAGSAPTTPTPASPFTFGAQPTRPVTPPSKQDDGMGMEASPTQMDTNGSKPAGTMIFGLGPTPVNPFGQTGSSVPSFTFGAPSTGASTIANPFAPKDENKPASDSTSGFNFNRTASAPTISTSFSLGGKSDQPTPPATAFGAQTNPFGQSQSTSSTPFAFGQPSAPTVNPFGAPSQPMQTSAAAGSTPSSPFMSTPTFTFGATASTGTNNPFAFGGPSTPSSPANGMTGLPQASGMTGGGPAFTFGQSSGTGSGSSLFNIGAPPPATVQGGGTPGRPLKKLPRRGPPPKR